MATAAAPQGFLAPDPYDEIMEVISSGEDDGGVAITPERAPKRRRKVVIDVECVNPECNVTGKDCLTTATPFVVAYYISNNKKKRKVCENCKSMAFSSREGMIQNLTFGRVISKGINLPLDADTVLLEDSDEEPKTDTSSESEFEYDDTVKNLENVIAETINKLKIGEQISHQIAKLKGDTEELDKNYEERDKEFKEIDKTIEDIRMNLYEPFRPKLKFLDPVDIEDDHGRVSHKKVQSAPEIEPPEVKVPLDLPAVGKLERPPLKVNSEVYFSQRDILNVWKKGKVLEILPKNPEGEEMFKVRVPQMKNGVCVTAYVRTARARLLAYPDPAPVRLQVGTRIIGVYREPSDPVSNGEFYSGIVAEPPKLMNNHRYLVFFDDGYASYITHGDIRVVVTQTDEQVWKDIHPNSREFIKKYLMQYPERPMVRLIKGQVVRTEWEGSWWFAEVEEVDASLVRLLFKVNGRRESIYRGSTRLEPLYQEMQLQKKRSEGMATKSYSRHNRNQNKPVVEYTRNAESNDNEGARRAVARKSTAATRKLGEPDKRVERAPMSSKGRIFQSDIPKVEGLPFVKHQCGPNCMREAQYTYCPKKFKNINPLLIPLALGWKRELAMYKDNGHRKIYYVSPCGRRLRNLEEVHRYLRVTSSQLEMDFFQFDWFIHPYNEFQPERVLSQLADISYGKENVLVPCINSLDHEYSEYIEYSTKRLPQANVHINTDEDFLACCDCIDDCQDKEKCACWQLTISHTNSLPGNIIDPSVGYNYRRLRNCVATGIYECNQKCKCKQTCLNRVAQNPLRQKLQVFKTENRGWGIRAMNDIPKGSFICIYVGNLYTNEEANQQGQMAGDEYFAELDMIETLERQKEGYESDVDDDDFNEDDVEVLSADGSSKKDGDYSADTEPEDDDPEFSTGGATGEITDRTTRSRGKILEKAAKKSTTASSEGEGDKRAIRAFDAPVTAPTKPAINEDDPNPKFASTRTYFGKNEDVYIMDAKSKGNIGRYLNHSCNPNVFVQNCFVDTHDLRFPWVAFFTSTTVKAGDELCWDYAYVVDQVQGKEINCACGANNCRGRLL